MKTLVEGAPYEGCTESLTKTTKTIENYLVPHPVFLFSHTEGGAQQDNTQMYGEQTHLELTENRLWIVRLCSLGYHGHALLHCPAHIWGYHGVLQRYAS